MEVIIFVVVFVVGFMLGVEYDFVDSQVDYVVEFVDYIFLRYLVLKKELMVGWEFVVLVCDFICILIS